MAAFSFCDSGANKRAVASGDDGKCRFYDGNLKLVGTIDGLDDADNVRYDPDAKLLYVGYGNGALAVIDPATMRKVGDVKLDKHPESFQLEAKGKRIFVNVPQSFSSQVHLGEKASVVVSELPQHSFPGIVSHLANSLDAVTRTEPIEVQVENPAHILLPGMYAQIQFSSARANPPLLIPGASVISRADGTSVAFLRLPDGQHGDARQVHLQKVALGRDYGVDTEILSGLQAGDTIASNPNDDVVEGAYVQPSGTGSGARK